MSVRVRADGRKFAHEICKIRDAINALGFTPTRFAYSWSEEEVAIFIRVDFSLLEEAALFSSAFGGELVNTSAAAMSVADAAC